jgi:pyruvate dehydrogenase E2 component (dihydrolipoamide acetyltransferase)
MSDRSAGFDAPYRDEEAPLLRRLIARRMTESKLASPHFYLTVDVDAQPLVELRGRLNAGRARKISYNDILMKAIGRLMAGHPECNASLVEDRLRFYSEVNVCLAVAIEGGLLTPTIRNCETKSIAEISDEAAALVEKARLKRLRPRESLGGTFTLTNLGMYGIEEFAAILNPPQPLILAVGAIRDTPVVNEGRIEVGKRMKLTLTCDHKVIDGSVGAMLLAELKGLLESPGTLEG